MGGSSDPPEPSREERELQKQQTELLKRQTSILEQQTRQQNLLAPLIFKESGINPTVDPDTGEITSFEIDPRFAEIQDRELGVKESLLSREEAALAGELPVNPGLTRDLDEQEAQLRERLRAQLGPGFEFSTPGQEALQKFGESKNILFDSARRGDLTLSEQLGASAQMREAQRLNQLFTGLSGPLDKLSTAQGFGATAGGAGNAAALLARQRLAQFQTQQGASSGLGSLIGGSGQFLGGAGSFASVFSD